MSRAGHQGTSLLSPVADARTARSPGSGVAAAFADAVESGRLDLPLPGGGRTHERWAALADLADKDLSASRSPARPWPMNGGVRWARRRAGRVGGCWVADGNPGAWF